MTKPTKAESEHWERILADEGMAEVSLFDNTGKNARAVQFISATCDEGGNDWFEHVNFDENGRVLRFEDTATAIAARKLSHDVSRLPSSWPVRELELLRHWSESGNFLRSCTNLGLPRRHAASIRRRFERFVKDSIQ